MVQILINDLKRHSASTGSALTDRLLSVVDSGWYVMGHECTSFEKAFANYIGADFCIGVGNGTDALEIGLRAIGVERGSKVATVANAGMYSVIAMMAIGAEPVFVDVDGRNQLMDLDHLRQRFTQDRIDAVVVTHLFGLMHDMDAVLRMCEEAKIPVLEDCAQAHGARREGYKAGSRGQVSTFSFYPTKNLGAMGDGGAVVTSDPAIAERLRLLRQYGWTSKYHSVIPNARNTRLDELQAAILNVKLPYLDGWNERRREIAARYTAKINHPLITCPPQRGDEYVAHLYVIQCEDRASLRRHLANAEISTDVHYPIPDYRQPCLEGGTGPALSLPVTEHLAQRNLTLPCFPELSDDEVNFIIDQVNAW